MQVGMKIVGLTVFAALVSAASETSATDRTVVSGSVCIPYDSTQMDRLTFNMYGAVNTSTTSNATVMCPLANHRPNIAVGNDPGTFVATVYNRNPSATLSCTLYRMGTSGNSVWSATASTPLTPFNTNAQTLVWNNLPTTTAQYSYALECSIPPATGNGLSHVTSVYYND